MLVNLHVKNLALIEELEVDFTQGLNILTGETGAGKSMILGSINLALGAKMSKEMIRESAPYALVELVFQVEHRAVQEKLKKLELVAQDDQIIITRKITGGRSISKINGETCTIHQVKEIAGFLLDIHGQHEHQSLLYPKKQLEILDQYGQDKIAKEKEIVKKFFGKYQALRQSFEEYQLDEEQRQRETAFLQFEIEEITKVSLEQGEDEILEKKYRKLSNGKKIVEAVSSAYGCCSYEEQGAGELVGRGLHKLLQVTQYDEELRELGTTLTDIDNLLNDFNRDLASYLSEVSFEEEEFFQIEQRLDIINHLKSKYGETIAEILENLREKKEKLEKLQHYEVYKKQVALEMQKAKEELETACEKLSKERKKYAKELEEEIKKGILELNFEQALFAISFSKKEDYSANGYDEIEFMISTNPGEPVKSLNKVASGGELSRIMLAIKTLLADKDETDTLIFDEIDTGISGRTAQLVSEKMAVIGKSHQVLCITHLAQIAAMADTHFVIEKIVEYKGTITTIRALTYEQSVEELARILGGAKITQTTIQSAGEMKELAQMQKNIRLK